MKKAANNSEQLTIKLGFLWKDPQDRLLVSKTIQALNARYDLNKKIANEPGVEEIVSQMFGRLANTIEKLSDLKDKRILDIACGSNSSKAPAALHINTPFGELKMGRASKSYTTLFEPWFCRILFELGANVVGIDLGNLDNEVFEHYRVDLGTKGSLDFLKDHSFDAVQDSRLFRSPEFTAQFPNHADRLMVAQEVRRQEHRLLKPGGIIIHSDAEVLLR